MAEKRSGRNGRNGKDRGTPWLEWTASGTGLVLAVSGIGYILWDGITSSDRPPGVQVQAERIIESPPGYTVEIRAANRSGTTAAGVLIEGEIRREGQTIETSETTFDYIPGGSERRGGLFFERDPRSMDLTVRAKGYSKP